MTVNLFGAPTGPGQSRTANLVQGSPDYQQSIVDQSARNLTPYYRQAAADQEADLVGRGLFDSGVAAQSGLGLRQQYLDALGRTAQEAAIGGADVNEQRARIQQARLFQLEDQATQASRLKEAEAREEERANQALWGNLIGVAAGAAGNYLGGTLGGTMATNLANQATQPEKEKSPTYVPPSSGGSRGGSIYGYPDYNAPRGAGVVNPYGGY